MWKKLFACLVALIVMGSVGYAYFNFQMDAASNYQAGGEIYGRLGDTFIKGDRILTGIVNPNNGNYMVWQILKKESYTDYGCGTTDTVCNNKVISGYITLASESIGKSAYGLTQNDYYYNGLVWGNYRVSKVFQDYLIPFSGSINARNRKIVTYRNLTSFHPNLWFRTCPATVDDPMFQDNAYLIYVGNVEGVLDGGGAISSADLMFDSAYWSNEVANDGGWSQFDASFFTTGGSIGNQLGGGPYNTAIDPDFKLDIRPALTMKLSDVVFAASLGKQGGMAHVKLREATGYSDIRSLEGDPMKVRILNTNMSANLNGIKGKDGSYINQIGEGQKVKLSVTANSGSDEEGNPYTISAVILDHAGNFINYMPLNVTANGESEYEFDVTGLSVGDYQLAVVNEAYSESDYSPADCSKLSNQLTFEIVPAPKIKYQAVYEGSPTTPNTHEYHVNVDVGDTIGKFTVQDGARPIQLSLICDDEADAEHANDYLQFELSKNVLSDNSEVFVKVKSGLHQGVYYFKIKAEDNFGICGYYRVQVTVNKTKLSIQFQQPQQTKKSIAEASTSWNETATANTSDGVKITYSISGGDIYLIDLDPDTGKITYKGAGGYGMVKIKATADDDPNSGNDNYEEAFTEKEVVIYREVDGIVTPHANSSNANVPTFQANDANVKTGGTIGTIKGTQGTPDTIGGNTTTYSYAMKSGENGSFFTVNANSGEIKTSANLAVGTYTFTITVSDKWSSKDIPVTVNVGMANAEDLKFYENSTSNTVINQKTVNFIDTNISVYATVKGSTNNNPVTYSLKAGEPTNVIDVNPNSGVVTIKGAGTVVIVATKQGANGQADAIAELTFTVSAGAQNFIYTTDSTLSTERPKTNGHYDALVETYATNKTFQLYTTGNPTGSTVTYQLKTGSPTDVISVDPNGQVTILNASMNNQIGKVIVEATSHDPSGNYSDKTIELPINIEKGTRTIAFAEHPINVLNGTGSVVPSILVEGVLDTEGNTTIEIDPSADSSIAWTNDGATIQYSWSGADGKDIRIHVTKPANRNYKIAEADGTLHILGADESALTLSTPGKITYGDHFTIRSTQDDSMSSNVQYTFETDNQVFVSVPQVNGNKAEFDAIGYSGSTEISVKVTRSADGELPLTKTVKIKVLPKPITIEIENKDRLRLEENPPLTYKDFKPQLVTWNGVQDTIDESVIKLSTSAVKYSPIGTYPIIAKNVQKQLNDNYPNYTFTIKEGLLNVKDNGDKNFWDVDDDGCPDLNIEIEDNEGNTILINGDKNEDGIPDYNIDKDGDGIPDLNIDTDKDGKPDLNLVILKNWKPSKCITLGDIQFSSGITAKPEINIDLDNDFVPDVAIDTDGDMKADINIDTDYDGKANVNIHTIDVWKPEQDYNYQGFNYDTMKELLPYLNIDTDGDGRPDVNIDLDGDGVADINVDTDGDLIPDVDIDSTGDGKPDINVDSDGDGKPDENLMDITEWKPEHNVDSPFAYDTMKIEDQKELEDNGISVEKPDGSTFPPNMELKVTDVTVNQKADVINGMGESLLSQQEVKQVFEIKLLENGKEIQPDGTLKIKIPITEGMINAILVRQNKDGTYEKLNASIENGYLVYESDELGIVAIIADKETEKEVAGEYYPGANTGGALTGDTSNPPLYMGIGFSSLSLLFFLLFKYKREEND